MKKLLLLLTIIIPSIAAGATTAKEVIDKTVETIRKAPSMSASLNIRANGNVSSGTILLSGDRFVIDSDLGSTWFDGTTMWSYSPETEEVTVTEPTGEELSEVNPFHFIKSAVREYTPKMLKSAPGNYTIELTPKKKMSISKAVITVDATNFYIRSISLTANRQIINIKLSAVRKGRNLPDSDFRFNKKLFPKAEINDMR